MISPAISSAQRNIFLPMYRFFLRFPYMSSCWIGLRWVYINSAASSMRKYMDWCHHPRNSRIDWFVLRKCTIPDWSNFVWWVKLKGDPHLLHSNAHWAIKNTLRFLHISFRRNNTFAGVIYSICMAGQGYTTFSTFSPSNDFGMKKFHSLDRHSWTRAMVIGSDCSRPLFMATPKSKHFCRLHLWQIFSRKK